MKFLFASFLSRARAFQEKMLLVGDNVSTVKIDDKAILKEVSEKFRIRFNLCILMLGIASIIAVSSALLAIFEFLYIQSILLSIAAFMWAAKMVLELWMAVDRHLSYSVRIAILTDRAVAVMTASGFQLDVHYLKDIERVALVPVEGRKKKIVATLVNNLDVVVATFVDEKSASEFIKNFEVMKKIKAI